MHSTESYAELLTAVPPHVAKVMSHVPQSLDEHRDISGVNSSLTVSSGLIFSSTFAGKGKMSVSNSLSVVFEREKERFYNYIFDLL